jgi:glycosyltransferase involved in cell wall biosynthesis
MRQAGLRVVIDGIIFALQPIGGISRIFQELIPRLCDAEAVSGVDLVISGPSLQTLPQHPRLKLYQTQLPDWLQPAAVWRRALASLVARRLRRRLEAVSGQVWHSSYFTMPLDWRGPVAVTVADLIYEFYPALFRGLDADLLRARRRRCVERADAVICISETTREDVIRHFGIAREKTFTVPLSHSAAFRQLTPELSDVSAVTTEPFILYVGGRAHYKQFGELLAAYAAWPGHCAHQLIIVGPPWNESELAQIESHGIRDRVRQIDGVDDDLLCRLYNRATAFVYPSLYEGFGIPLLEAMACGCPVVASRIPSTVEVAGDAPIYFTAGASAEFTAALVAAANEGRESARVSAGLEWVKQYSWDRTAAGTLAVYQKLIEWRGGNA